VLARAGWDVEDAGLAGAPRVNLVIGAEAHVTIVTALRMLGLGSRDIKRVAVDGQGRMRPDSLREVLSSCDGPTIVCAQAGNVNTGAFDPLGPIADAVHERGGWLHVDGAFGLWAAASPALRALCAGGERADSWTIDGHKWLNVPYDSGAAIVRDADAHRAAVSHGAAYYVAAAGGERDNHHFVPEASRRARGFAVWAALRSLGREGCAELIERCCALARLFAERLRDAPGVAILNDVVLNQVLVRFGPPGGGDADAFTREVIRRIQADGTCWAGGTVWRGQTALRISVSNAATTEADVEQSAAAVRRCAKT
jgi:glutamate/tyrosine decarboxylase-like PLP-dependent enzyme